MRAAKVILMLTLSAVPMSARRDEHGSMVFTTLGLRVKGASRRRGFAT
jgi:hypothetical protein